MLNTHVQPRSSEQGFTLVELAIVMVIIGLLIGGILKGQELISSAKVSSTVSQLKGTDAAFSTFQDKYNALPGDIQTPNTRLPNCTAAPCSTEGLNGTIGNGRIESGNATPASVPNATSEAGLAFVQLAAADLIGGINSAGGVTNFGGQFPAVKAGGGMWVAYSTGVIAASLPQGRHYAALNGSVQTVGAATGAFTPTIAAQIDRKLDDGQPNTGAMQVVGTSCATATGAAGIYAEGGTANALCALYTRVLN